MAELELAVTYQTRYMRAVYFLVLLLFPFWSIVAPGLLACTLPFVISFSHQIAPQWTALYLFGLTGMLFGGLGLSAIAEDTRIRISKNGLSFPPLLMPLLKFQRDYSWNDLAVADFDGDQEDRSHKLRLSFKSGRAIALDLNRLKPSELEQVLMSVELWGATCERTPSLITYQASVQNQNRGMEKLGYTQMWEEELGRRFHATSFVPLEPGAQLQNKKYNVVRQLAFGGFSAIYLSQRNNSDLVVLKEAVVPTDGDTAAIEAAQKHLKRESEMLARLSHETHCACCR